VIVVALALAAAFGAVSRAELDTAVQRRLAVTFPGGTLAVNVLGCFAAGVVAGLAGAGQISEDVRTVLATGFLGGFTTFSTWAVDSVRLPRPVAVANVVVSLAVGLVAVVLGRWLAA